MLIKKKNKYPCDWFCGPGSHIIKCSIYQSFVTSHI